MVVVCSSVAFQLATGTNLEPVTATKGLLRFLNRKVDMILRGGWTCIRFIVNGLIKVSGQKRKTRQGSSADRAYSGQNLDFTLSHSSPSEKTIRKLFETIRFSNFSTLWRTIRNSYSTFETVGLVCAMV